MRVFKYIYSILFLFIIVNTSNGQGHEPPRLVVGIMVDGLQQKHLDMLWAYFDPSGFKKIMSGTRCRNVSYNIVSAGKTSDVATIMTGSIPFYHGITGDYVLNKSTAKPRQPIYDEQEIGIGTKETYSAYNLLASTIVDELILTYPSKARAYSVAINPAEAIMLGGHTANGVVWMDDVQHQWVTTGYYKEGLCKSAFAMNQNGMFKNISSREWKPMYAINTYLSSVGDAKKTDFSIKPTTPKKKSNATILRNTPSANSLVADLASRIVEDEKLGQDNITDMLMLQFTVRTPDEKVFSLQSVEKEDMYLRLDRDIQALLQKLDARVGLDKTLVFLFSNQTDVHSPTELGKNHVPAGYFSATRSMSLLNTYLMALYGQEKWVTGYYGKNIYLNKQKIEEKKLNFTEIQKQVAAFMPEFEGIQAAYPAQQVLTMGGDADSEIARLRNSTHKNSMGDVIITLMPGWMELDEDMRPVGESNAITSFTPLAFYGWKVKPQLVNTMYQVTDIAPTLSRILNIPVPNASIGKPIKEIME